MIIIDIIRLKYLCIYIELFTESLHCGVNLFHGEYTSIGFDLILFSVNILIGKPDDIYEELE